MDLCHSHLTGHSEKHQEQRIKKEDPRLLLHRLGGHHTPEFSLFRVPHEKHQPRLLCCCCTVIKLLKGWRGLRHCYGKPGMCEGGACREAAGDLSAHWSCPKSLPMRVWLPEWLLDVRQGHFPNTSYVLLSHCLLQTKHVRW